MVLKYLVRKNLANVKFLRTVCGDHSSSDLINISNISNYADLPLHSIGKKLYQKTLYDQRRYYYHHIDASFRQNSIFQSGSSSISLWVILILKECHFSYKYDKWTVHAPVLPSLKLNEDLPQMFASNSCWYLSLILVYQCVVDPWQILFLRIVDRFLYCRLQNRFMIWISS